jgi:phage tail-like protein
VTEQASSYLRHLPPVLWADGAAPSDLGRLLLVFEKILSGIDDDVPATRPGLEVTIDQLHRLFEPWATPAERVDALARWVGLELPPELDEYRRRRAVGRIAGIHRARGRREGLQRRLELTTPAAIRPRIVVDDGALLLSSRPEPDRVAPVDALLSQGAVRTSDTTAAHAGLVRPRSIAVSPEGDLLVGDEGMPGNSAPVRPAVWRLTRTGAYADLGGSPPRPVPLPATPSDDAAVGLPGALAVDARSDPWRLYVLDSAGEGLFRITAPELGEAVPVATPGQLGMGTPAAMAFDDRGHLIVLDRSPALLDVDLTTDPLPTPRRHPLTTVQQPRSLLVRADGTLVVGDVRDEDSTDPGDLVLVDRTDDDHWREESLLGALGAGDNPLVAPFAIVEEAADRLLVLDLGLRPEASGTEPFSRTIAEPAVVHRVTLTPGGPVVTRATEAGRMVHPTGMVLHEGTLHVCDGGERELSDRDGAWRTAPHEFGVLVHFSAQRPTTEQQRRTVLRHVRELVTREKPAGSVATLWSVDTDDRI